MRFDKLLEYHINFRILSLLIDLKSKRAMRRVHLPKRWRNDILSPPLKVGAMTKSIITKHYLEGRYVKGVKPVAWVTSGAPVEILKALGFYILYPENHAALCGARKVAVEIASEAEKRGYSMDLCSYARVDIGSALTGKTPVGMLPKPDLLLACTNICQTVLFWYRVLAEHFGVPLIVIDTPFLYNAKVEQHQVEYVKRQLEESIPIAERVAKRSLKFERLKRVTALSKDATELWYEIMKRNRNVPAPISVFDQFIHMAPIVEKRGDPETVDFYAAMLKEVDERIKRNIGAVKNEKRRLLWDNLPIWFMMRFLSELLAEHGTAVVVSTYTNAWGELADIIDPQRPIESMARTYLMPILNRSAGDKLNTMRQMAEEYKLNGAILHSDRSCKPYSIGQVDERSILASKLKIPALLLEADHNDPRSCAEAQIKSRIEAFMELLGV